MKSRKTTDMSVDIMVCMSALVPRTPECPERCGGRMVCGLLIRTGDRRCQDISETEANENPK